MKKKVTEWINPEDESSEWNYFTLNESEFSKGREQSIKRKIGSSHIFTKEYPSKKILESFKSFNDLISK